MVGFAGACLQAMGCRQRSASMQAPATRRRRLEPKELLRVFVKQLPLDRLARRELADLRDLARAGAESRLRGDIGAIAAKHQLVLVPLEKFARVLRIALEGVFTGAGGEIA